MQKPTDYDSTQEATGGSFDNPPAGGTILSIVKAEEVAVKNGEHAGEPMLALELDIALGPYTNFYRKLSDKLGKSMYLRHNRVLSQVNYFKGDIKAIEKSNPGFTFNFDEKTLIHKLVGGALREEEYIHGATQEIRSSLKIAFLCSIEDVKKGLPVPKPKRISFTSNTNQQPTTEPDFGQTPSNQEKLPF
jgi:hypothetical protein